MRFFLPSGAARLERPAAIRRYTFEDFVHGLQIKKAPGAQTGIVPLEAVSAGDAQVLAAQDLKAGPAVMELDALAGFPSVESVVASSGVTAARELPNVRELLLCSSAAPPGPATVSRLTGLEALYCLRTPGRGRLDLDSLPAPQMRKLAASRW